MKRACVVGWPARHSRSPLIHNSWLEAYGLAGSYGIEEVAESDFAPFLAGLPELGYAGCNVTLPHKEAACRLVERREAVADALGAVNTVWLEGGRLVGANTDVEGFLANLDASAPGWDEGGPSAVVLGAGGAARGIVYGLLTRGVSRVIVVNRTLQRAAMLAREFGPKVDAAGWSGLADAFDKARLVVNATSLGMSGKAPLEVDLTPLPDNAIVNDIVYVPLETDLIRAARARGLRTVDGLGMLLYQAVPGFERWFGVRPEVTPELRDLVARDIEKR